MVMPDRDRAKVRRKLWRQVDAGALATDKALAALKALDPADFPPYMIPKLLEVGRRSSPRRMRRCNGWRPRNNPRVTPGK
jgi:hypothetical protein